MARRSRKLPQTRAKAKTNSKAIRIVDGRLSSRAITPEDISGPAPRGPRLRSRTRDNPSQEGGARKRIKFDKTSVSEHDMQIANNHVEALSSAYLSVLSKHLGVDYLDGKGSDLKRIEKIEDLCTKELYYTTLNYDGTLDPNTTATITPGQTRARSLTEAIWIRRTNNTNFGPLPTVPVGTVIRFSAFIHKIELKGWPFGIPSIQGCSFFLIRATGDQTLSDVINNGWGFGGGDNANGYGMFWDPTKFEVLTTTMSLSRDPVFQGVDQILDFSEEPLKLQYRARRDVSPPWVFEQTVNDVFLVIRNTRKTNEGAPDNIVNWIVSCRIWFSVS